QRLRSDYVSGDCWTDDISRCTGLLSACTSSNKSRSADSAALRIKQGSVARCRWSGVEQTMYEWKSAIREHLYELRLSPARETEIIEELSQHLQQRFDEL